MFQKTKGIVLHSFKYTESQIIAHIYTEHFGRQSYYFRQSKSKKEINKRSLLQTLFVLEMDVQIKENRQMQKAKEIRNFPVFNSIPFNIYKSSIAIFLAEVLSKVLKEEEPNKDLFDFLYHSILLLDEMEKGIANFHLLFLYQLSKYLGFKPENPSGIESKHFDIRSGHFKREHLGDKFVLSEQTSKIIADLSVLGFHQLSEMELSGKMRQRLLKELLIYFQYHLPEMGEIKSLDIFKEIFSNK